MMYFGIFLTVYGAILLVGFLLNFPFLYNNVKSRALIKMMGKKWFNVLIVVMGLTTFVLGLYLIGAL
jgi:hypothetical protein